MKTSPMHFFLFFVFLPFWGVLRGNGKTGSRYVALVEQVALKPPECGEACATMPDSVFRHWAFNSGHTEQLSGSHPYPQPFVHVLC